MLLGRGCIVVAVAEAVGGHGLARFNRETPPVDTSGLKSRVRMVVAQQKSKGVANNHVANILKTCNHVQKNKGAVARV